jgi:hypothetical protein
MLKPTERVAYLQFATRAVAAANRDWRERHPERAGDVLLAREALHYHLFRWAIRSGRIPDPGPRRVDPFHAYVAAVYAEDPAAVQAEARDYYRKTLAGRRAELQLRDGGGDGAWS